MEVQTKNPKWLKNLMYLIHFHRGKASVATIPVNEGSFEFPSLDFYQQVGTLGFGEVVCVWFARGVFEWER